jgi:2,4-dienoyl-CoA reductase-like NADH-dependent reductase (Old Yellow Enzyme family)
MAPLNLHNKGAAGIPYYTPAQEPPAGTAEDPDTAPTLFQPVRTGPVELHNRIVVSPMCMYSADDGHLTDFHLVHLGQFAMRGAGLVLVEATAVEARGRISPQDAGLWQDSQVAPMRRVVDFAHGQGVKAGIQLGHAGRKASTVAPWLRPPGGKFLADETVGGWPGDVVGPSAIPWDEGWAMPKELSIAEIKDLVQRFVDAAVRASEAGFDVVELHAAHGYLITSFLSPVSNVSRLVFKCFSTPMTLKLAGNLFT